MFKKKKRKKLHIYLFRHGKTTFNEKGIFTGWKDARLTKSGLRDANAVARKLKYKKFQVAFHTRLTRSTQTLKPVLKFHPECKKIIKDDRMIERSYGELEGTTHESFVKRIGEQSLNLRIHGDALVSLSPKKRKWVEQFLGKLEYKIIHRGWRVPPPGGESFKMVEKRVKKFMKYLKKFMKKNQVNVAISAHGNSIRLFRKIMEKSSKQETISWFIPYDKVFHYEIKV